MTDFPLTPGAYLKHRRQAARLAIDDLAAALATEPRIAQHVRADWIVQIEADVMPASFATIVALRCAFAFDLHVLERLALINGGADLEAPRLCRICACSDDDSCSVGVWPCSWATKDLCSSCVTVAPAMAASR